MHDPLVVAFEIRRPWPSRRDSTGKSYRPPLITVWHREPGGHDSGDVCKHHSRVPDLVTGEWRFKLHHGWRLHIHHWKIQVHALQELRRRLLTRCAWCGDRSRKGDAVNVRHQWDGVRSRWWQGERGLYHWDCSSVAHAHISCVCEQPLTANGRYGSCARCGKFRGFGKTVENLAFMRRMAAVPQGARP